MAEQEVIKHTKKVFTLWSGSKGFWHKIGEFILEIFIIVFAISLSIYLHDRSVVKHQRHETREFLLGLKEDLKTDILEMEEDRKAFTISGKAFTYLTSIRMNEPIHRDSMKKYNNYIFNTTGLVPNSGRFEGFKSSGKIGTIENKDLQNNIMDLYQENIPSLITSTAYYTAIKQKLFDFVAAGTRRITDSTNNLLLVMGTDPAYNICLTLTRTREIVARYDLCMNKMKAIIEGIDKKYSGTH